jgi:hypothetical protein
MAENDRLRSLEEALADLLKKYEEHPSPELGRMIKQLELEIAERKDIRGGRGNSGAPQARPRYGPRQSSLPLRSCRITSNPGSATRPGASMV